jgi:flagellar basal-body rod protein FlgB
VARNCREELLAALIIKLLFWPPDCLHLVAMLDDPLSGKLERYMDLLSARQNLVSSNIANADTPGYRTQDIDFQAEFQNAMGGAPHVVQPAGLAVKNDGNNVSIDRETRLLSENALRFSVASNLMRGQISALRSAIKEGA